jgi:cysteine desulfurase
MVESIYVDHAATSPTHPDVVKEMLPFFTEQFGNPSSIHKFGRATRHQIDLARKVIADSIQAKPNEIIFTSGGTEADNLAIIGTAYANRSKGNHIITTKIEHHAVLHTCEYLEQNGFEVTYLPVNETGIVSIADLQDAIRENTILATIMFGNNEIGTIQPIQEIGTLLQEYDILFHTDAVQAYGLVDIDVQALNIDLLSVSAHKINGPRGIGFLYKRDGVEMNPSTYGGEQERKRRAGTENVPGIIGMKKAVELMKQGMDERNNQYIQYRKTLTNILNAEGIIYEVNGKEGAFLPHIINISFKGVTSEPLLVNLDLEKVAASSGSACTAGSFIPSHVLAAMYGDDDPKVHSALRFSFGYGNTNEQITEVAKRTAMIINRIKKS